MAKFIAIPAPSTVAATIGEVLIAAEGIITTDALTDTTTAIYYGNKTVTLTYNETFLFNTSVRDAINAALTANPGGEKVKVQLPAGVTISGVTIA